MNIKIIDLISKFKRDYKLERDIKLYKEFQDSIYVYIENPEDISIYKYIKSEDRLEKFKSIPFKLDIRNQHFKIIYLDQEEVIYEVIENNDSFKIYRNLDTRPIHISLNKDLILLNKDYGIVYNVMEEISYLLELRTGKTYHFQIDTFKNSLFKNTRLLKVNGKEYIFHTRHLLDNYDGDISFRTKDLVYTSGVYYMDFSDFIDSIKDNKKPIFKGLLEAREGELINPVLYDDFYSNPNYESNYHFTKIDYRSKEISLYNIDLKSEELGSIMLAKYSYKDYDNAYNLVAKGYPVKIYKHTSLCTKDEYRIFHPCQSSIQIDKRENECITNILKDYIISWAWKEGDNKYEDITRIRTRDGSNLVMDIYGECKLSMDRKSLILYNRASIETKGWIVEEGYEGHTDVKKIFRSMDDFHLDYNWLITDMEAYPKTEEMKKLVDSKYIWVSGEELDLLMERENFNWVNAVFSGFSKYMDRNEIISRLPSIDSKFYWQEDIKLSHPLSQVEIVAIGSSITLILASNKRIINGFKDRFPMAKDLSYSNLLAHRQMEMIDKILMENKLIEKIDQTRSEDAIRIWTDLYKDHHMNEYIKIKEDDVLSYMKRRNLS